MSSRDSAEVHEEKAEVAKGVGVVGGLVGKEMSKVEAQISRRGFICTQCEMGF